MAREFMPQYPQAGYPEDQLCRITSDLSYLSSTHLASPHGSLLLHHEPRLGPLALTPLEHDFPSRPISRSTVNALFNATSNDSPRRRATMRPGTPGSSKTSSDVSLKDVQSSDIDFKDKASQEKERLQKELRIMQNQIR